MDVTATKSKTRRPAKARSGRASDLFEELIIDSFAGGGGASLGIERALGRAVDVAINHDRASIDMHQANHPHTRHLCEDVWTVDLKKVVAGRKVGLGWFSPDCRHFSRAKGGKPVEKKIRALAWVVIREAKRVRPRVIILENVREFEEWGPLEQAVGTDGKPLFGKHGPAMMPCKDRKGETFKKWLGQLRKLGYHVEWRQLNAADYGAPTHRRRLFLIARCDGAPVVWPEPTHGPGRKHPYRTAASCIDWSLPCPSIFLSREEGRKVNVNRPLAEKTMRRIAMGVKRYVLDNPRRYIVRCDHGGDHFRGQSLDAPLGTVTGKHGYGLVTPFLAQRYGEGPHQETRGQNIDEPIRTVTPANNSGVLVSPVLVQVQNASSPTGHRDVERPAHTVTANPKGGGMALVSAFLAKHYTGVVGHGVERPIGTVTSIDHHSLVAVHLLNNRNNCNGGAADAPVHTITSSGGHAALVYSFLIKYFATGIGQALPEPLHTATTKPRFGLVTVQVDGEPYVIADIGLRMLTPRELARAQGFPDDYILTGTKSNQVARIGNSVCPVMAEVLVGANCADMAAPRRAARKGVAA